MGGTKTALLMTGLMLIFMYIGDLIAGAEGMKNAFWIAAAMNFYYYFFSDKLVLKHYKAKAVNEKTEPELYEIVARLAKNAELPMPKVYIIDEEVPNAFATGRNPKHAAVAATSGLLKLMSAEEIEGVLAHEMSHVKHRDILISTIASVFAGAITMLARIGQGANNRKRAGLYLISAILTPIAASIIQMTISRTREYAADEGAAKLTGHPEWLMNALSKLDGYAKSYQMKRASIQTAHMFIVNPFSSLPKTLSNLFSTHPTTEDRLARLEQIRQQIGG